MPPPGSTDSARGGCCTVVVDACVLIDWIGADVLDAVMDALGAVARVVVPDVVLDEVDGLSAQQCADLGIVVVETPLEAAHYPLPPGVRRRLSAQDRTCLWVAANHGAVLLTNDSAMAKAWRGPLLRSLGLLLELIRYGRMSKRSAHRTATALHEANPKYITAQILADFVRELEDIP